MTRLLPLFYFVKIQQRFTAQFGWIQRVDELKHISSPLSKYATDRSLINDLRETRFANSKTKKRRNDDDQIGLFLKGLGFNFVCKRGPIFANFWALWKTTLEVKTAKETCRATFGKINRTTFNSIIWSHWCWLSLLFMKVSSDENLSSFVPLLFAKNNHFDFKRYS